MIKVSGELDVSMNEDLGAKSDFLSKKFVAPATFPLINSLQTHMETLFGGG